MKENNINTINMESILETVFEAIPDFGTNNYFVDNIEIEIIDPYSKTWRSLNQPLQGMGNLNLVATLMNHIPVDMKKNVLNNFKLPELIDKDVLEEADIINLFENAYPIKILKNVNFNERERTIDPLLLSRFEEQEQELGLETPELKEINHAQKVKEQILKLTDGSIDPHIMSSVLDLLIEETCKDVSHTIDNYLVKNRAYLDEWSIGLGYVSGIIQDDYLTPPKPKKLKR